MESSPNFCSQCGASLSPGDAFCSQCGTSVGGGATRVRDTGAGSVGDGPAPSDRSGPATTRRSAFRRRVAALADDGWDVERDYGDRVVMVDRYYGSAAVHALLFVVTWGLGNVLYAAYCSSTRSDRVELSADRTDPGVLDRDGRHEDSPDGTAENAGSLGRAILCTVVGFGILNGGGLPALVVGVALVLYGISSFPPIRRRLDDRRSATTFGWMRSTDETVVDAPDVPCAACSRPVGTGVERAYHETLYVAGLPVTTDEEGRNRYCRSCAQGDPFAGHDLGDAHRETVREV